MVMSVLLVVQISMRGEWRSATVGSGEQSVITYGAQLMQGWLADSLATQELVGFIQNTLPCGVGGRPGITHPSQ